MTLARPRAPDARGASGSRGRASRNAWAGHAGRAGPPAGTDRWIVVSAGTARWLYGAHRRATMIKVAVFAHFNVAYSWIDSRLPPSAFIGGQVPGDLTKARTVG